MRVNNHFHTTNGHAKAASPPIAAAAPIVLPLAVDPEALRQLVRAVVAEALEQLGHAQTALSDGRVCYSETEAAALLGLNPHQLRDERLRGRIAASAVVGRRIRYRRGDLERYLAERPWQPTE